MTVDFRSDTVTKPTPGMLQAMIKAEVGDDVFGEDPTVNKLETITADLFGMEAALYCPTGTMSNQIAIKAHTQSGDEVLCDKTAHIYQYEGGGIAANSGCQVKVIDGNKGRITASQIETAINPDDVHRPRTALVCLENTSNRGGGSCYDFDEIKKIKNVCEHHNLILHLDGARLFNAIVAKNETAKQYGYVFTSISVCLNKGLGCPTGSMLIGTMGFIKKARRVRKVFGGGMRQAGYMAACGIYALEQHIERLAEDHHHACLLNEVLQRKKFVDSILPVETNIIIFEVKRPYTAREIAQNLQQKNILVIPISDTQIRMVLHLDITPDMIKHTIAVINSL